MIPTNKYTEFFSHYIKGTNNTLRVCVCVCVCVCVKLLQLYLILWDPVDYSPPGYNTSSTSRWYKYMWKKKQMADAY